MAQQSKDMATKADTAELKASIFLALFAAMGLMIAAMVAVNKLL